MNLILGKTYIIKYTIIGLDGIIFTGEGIFKEIYHNNQFDWFTQSTIKETFISLIHSSHPWSGTFTHSYNIADVISCRCKPRFSLKETTELQHRVRLRERRNIQRGLTGKVPYDVARLIASYV